MELRVDRIRALMEERNWSSSELARQMGVSKAEITRLFNRKRKGGNKVISGLKRAFPDEPLESFFYFPVLYPNVNAKHDIVPDKGPVQIRHPDAHQLACTVDEQRGQIEIIEGKNRTILIVPPGHINVQYSKVEN